MLETPLEASGEKRALSDSSDHLRPGHHAEQLGLLSLSK